MKTTEMKKGLDALYDSLIEILRREIEIYREIREVILEEKKILMKPSLEELYGSNARKETCILKAKLLEEVRGNIVRKIAAALGLAAEKITLSVIVCSAAGDRSKTLGECQGMLRSLFGDIQDLNERNKVLLDTSLLFLRSSVGFINDLMSPGTAYMDTGKMKAAGRNGKIFSAEG